MSWWLLHVDMDQFIAAVEIRRRPELRGLPVVVGGSGDPTQPRQVVATASYEARAFGVRSGMPVRAAYKKCPEAVFLPSDPATYEAASTEVMDTLRSFPVVVEVWGWDECFVGAETDDPEALATELRAAVEARTTLTCSVGIGDNKTRAKLATGFAKHQRSHAVPFEPAADSTTAPAADSTTAGVADGTAESPAVADPVRSAADPAAGIYRLTAANWRQVMDHRPVRDLWGVGARMEHNLNELGITTVAELAAADVELLKKRFGPKMGTWYAALGRGLGDTQVTDIPREPVSRSREETFPQDLTDPTTIAEELRRIAIQVTDDVVAEGRTIQRIWVKVRFTSFYTPAGSGGDCNTCRLKGCCDG
ncbi:DNA polymerase IV, partial [Kribbella hippodromi]|uniref:DNA polymerase IV n=1 Tax=Kribbella hippodromi TaxID=434347 RepID=UPI0031DEE989